MHYLITEYVTLTSCKWSIASVPEVVTAGWVWVQPLTLAFVYVGTTIKNIADISQGGGDFTRGHFVSDLTYLFMCLSHYLHSHNMRCQILRFVQSSQFVFRFPNIRLCKRMCWLRVSLVTWPKKCNTTMYKMLKIISLDFSSVNKDFHKERFHVLKVSNMQWYQTAQGSRMVYLVRETVK
jgi:hypothetical protein